MDGSTEAGTEGATEAGYHYRIIARAIAEIDAGPPGMSLDALAARIGLSPAHFQRVFTAWVGVSPKRYQQYLTLDAARRMLAAHHGTLETALAAGLSGPGRLHDLFLRWEAMAPGAYARAGAGLTLRHATLDSAFGPVVAMLSDHGICGLALAAETGEAAALDDLAARWPRARLLQDHAAVAGPVAAALAGRGARLHLMGTPLRLKVWEALLALPEGQVTSYADLARAVGQPRAVRAVGSAVGANPVAVLIPCHRVLRRDGALGGYRWGLPVKRALMAREAARADAGP